MHVNSGEKDKLSSCTRGKIRITCGLMKRDIIIMERIILSLPFRYRREKLKIVKNKNYEIENNIICANIISLFVELR